MSGLVLCNNKGKTYLIMFRTSLMTRRKIGGMADQDMKVDAVQGKGWVGQGVMVMLHS